MSVTPKFVLISMRHLSFLVVDLIRKLDEIIEVWKMLIIILHISTWDHSYIVFGAENGLIDSQEALIIRG